ncbi:MAG: hypothetical protein AAFV71_26535 [Cyanobacteria bacterium J06633_8]
MRKHLDMLLNAIWQSIVYGILLNLLISIIVSISTSGLVGLIFFVPLSFIVGLTSAFINPLLLLSLAESSFLCSCNRTLNKFVFTFIGAAFGAIFGAIIMFSFVEDDKMLDGMANTLTQASSLIAAVSYGITNYKFACWHQSKYISS